MKRLIKNFLNFAFPFQNLNLSLFSTEKWYPRLLAVPDHANQKLLTSLQSLFSEQENFEYAEIGVYEGQTCMAVAKLFPNARLSLFDYTDRLTDVEEKIRIQDPDRRINFFSNSYKYLDSYNWSLVKLLEKKDSNLFHFVYLDGSHTFAVDGLAFFLIDKLLAIGGHIYFDDYDWTLRNSSLDPKKLKLTRKMYTSEQIDSFQMKLVIDLFVKSNENYIEVIPNVLFKKIN